MSESPETVLPVWDNIGQHNPDPGPYIDHQGFHVSERQVIYHGSYYLGRTYNDPQLGNELPYSKESVEDYDSREEAQAALDANIFTFRKFP